MASRLDAARTRAIKASPVKKTSGIKPLPGKTLLGKTPPGKTLPFKSPPGGHTYKKILHSRGKNLQGMVKRMSNKR
jgi:hypothetical protein